MSLLLPSFILKHSPKPNLCLRGLSRPVRSEVTLKVPLWSGINQSGTHMLQVSPQMSPYQGCVPGRTVCTHTPLICTCSPVPPPSPCFIFLIAHVTIRNFTYLLSASLHRSRSSNKEYIVSVLFTVCPRYAIAPVES